MSRVCRGMSRVCLGKLQRSVCQELTCSRKAFCSSFSSAGFTSLSAQGCLLWTAQGSLGSTEAAASAALTAAAFLSAVFLFFDLSDTVYTDSPAEGLCMVHPVCRSHVLNHYNDYLDLQSARDFVQLPVMLPVMHASMTCCPLIQQALQLSPLLCGC